MANRPKKKVRERRGIDKRYAHSSERSPYWDDFESSGRGRGDVGEHVEANPDSLREDEGMYASEQPSTPQFLMGEAVDHLQGRQREVYILVMREGKSLAEAAEVLGIEKGSAQKYKERAIRFISAWCKNAISKGRV